MWLVKGRNRSLNNNDRINRQDFKTTMTNILKDLKENMNTLREIKAMYERTK